MKKMLNKEKVQMKSQNKKQNILLKNSLKEIKVNRKRFISILIMALLGVGFFAGLVASGPDMRDSLDTFLDETNTYDINVASTLGLTDDDILEISKIDGTENVTGTYSQDVIVLIDNMEYVFKAIGIRDNINTLSVVEGRLPENNNECVVEEKFINTTEYEIGDTIVLEDDEENDYFKEDEVTIVGSVLSPLYVSTDRGTTSLRKR